MGLIGKFQIRFCGLSMSRIETRRLWRGQNLQQETGRPEIYVRSACGGGLAEAAYKNIDEVIQATEVAGITQGIVRYTPIETV